MQNMNILAGVLVASLATASPAHADFGHSGTKAIDGNLDLGVGKSTETSPSGDEASSTVAAAAVGASYFIVDRVSLGGRVALGYQRRDEDISQTVMGLMLAGGFAHALGERTYLWPRAGLAVSRATVSIGDDSASMLKLGLQLQAPVYIQPADHLLIGFGPALSLDLAGTIHTDEGDQDASKTTDVGLIGSLVGWW